MTEDELLELIGERSRVLSTHVRKLISSKNSHIREARKAAQDNRVARYETALQRIVMLRDTDVVADAQRIAADALHPKQGDT